MAHNRRYGQVEVVEAFKKMPSFRDDHIDVDDLNALFATMKYTCTEEQRAIYRAYLRDFHNKKLSLDLAVACFAVIDDPKEMMRHNVTAMDKDKNGFIDESEFKCIVQLLLIHDPNFPRVDYNKFFEEADVNKDGKVSIDEAVEWIGQNVPK
ncbi:uncharacterized protein LOC118439503 [Folsomia candida]|uniref:Parvalbumin alpha n=1 Tax=Folsomia candida TaxID=158441 RepID=A0A226D222_FOLCA|nr:uncharacterized protein LOC118439503 [Folsomia candida]OXA39632.1 Parvalbumin alpha [Folsomia candida]